MQKRKNNASNHAQRNLLIMVMIFGVLVLLFVYTSIQVCGCSRGVPETATAIVATNNAVATLIEQTRAAAIMIKTQVP